MSTETHNTKPRPNGEPHHDTVTFEPRDVEVRTIYWYLFSLAVATILAFGATIFILRVTSKIVADSDAETLPMRKAMTEKQKAEHAFPPEPRLQGVPGHENDPQEDSREKVRADMAANEQYRWIDANSGIAQIPVSEAMKLIVAKGVTGSTPAVPSEAAKPAALKAPATERKN
jgi:hypothetical protein